MRTTPLIVWGAVGFLVGGLTWAAIAIIARAAFPLISALYWDWVGGMDSRSDRQKKGY